MARWEEERRYHREVNCWRVVIRVLGIIRLILQIKLIILVIILNCLPLSPYVRLPDTEAGYCRYLGGRGLWQPGWASHCPTTTLRQHFYVDY